MNCIIIEDQPPAQRILKRYIADYGVYDLVGTFSDALQALEFLKGNSVDLIFLDIHLPKLSGIDFLKTLDRPPSVILTTAFSEFALESYDLNVVDYLLKPFSFPRFIKAVSKVVAKQETNGLLKKKMEPIFIKSGHEYIKVEIEDITFIHSDRDYTEIVTSKMKYLSAESLNHWENFFQDFSFMRVHKSYLINREKIIKVKSATIEMTGDISVPIGRAYKDNVSVIIRK